MCIEFAFKRGGITLIRNFLHSAEGVKKYTINHKSLVDFQLPFKTDYPLITRSEHTLKEKSLISDVNYMN